MSKVFLLFGSNLGDRFKIIADAEELTQQAIGEIVKASSLFESEPWGFEHNNKFLNKVLVINTANPPDKVLQSIQRVETTLGRVRNNSGAYIGRTIDIDILFYDDLILNEEDLKIPHPLLHKRRFTLKPLVEIVPTFNHPVLHKTMQQLLDECPDEQDAVQVSPDGKN